MVGSFHLYILVISAIIPEHCCRPQICPVFCANIRMKVEALEVFVSRKSGVFFRKLPEDNHGSTHYVHTVLNNA
jgi:hypothetical protein